MAQIASKPQDLTPVAQKPAVENVKNLRYLRDKDREIVRGIFRFFEVPGGTNSFSIKLYKEDPVERYDLTDGQVYSLPLGIAKHLNKNGWYPEYGFLPGEDSKSIQKVTRKVRRFGFQSLEFVDIEELSTNPQAIVNVDAITRNQIAG